MTLQRILRWRSRPGWPSEPDDLLIRQLEALASRQAPDVGARVAGRRDALLDEFRRASAVRRNRVGLRMPRLAPALAGAALLVVLTAGSLAASGPGLPLYGVRLVAEELVLPAAGPERLTAQLDRLDRRLEEAAAATRRGDAHAAAAALHAYEEIAAELRAGPIPDGTDVPAADRRLEEQIRRLEQLQAADPGSSQAIGSARSTLTWLAGRGPGQGSPSPAPEGSQPAPSPHPSSGAGGASSRPASPLPTGAEGSTAPLPTPAASSAGGPEGTGGPGTSPGGQGEGGTNSGRPGG
jgi:hypothetical protein